MLFCIKILKYYVSLEIYSLICLEIFWFDAIEENFIILYIFLKEKREGKWKMKRNFLKVSLVYVA